MVGFDKSAVPSVCPSVLLLMALTLSSNDGHVDTGGRVEYVGVVPKIQTAHLNFEPRNGFFAKF